MPHSRASKYMQQNLIELQVKLKSMTPLNSWKVFNTPFSAMDWFSRKKISEVIMELSSTINQWDIVDIYRLFHTTEKTTFSSLQETFTKTDYILGHKYPNKFKRIHIIQCLLADHDGRKLEINTTKIAGNPTNTENFKCGNWMKMKERENTNYSYQK